MAAYPYQRNLGYWTSFMRQYGMASQTTRDELYRDTVAYSHGEETALELYQQTYQLLAVSPPSPQVYVGG